MSWNVRSKWTTTMTVLLHLIALSQSTDDAYIHSIWNVNFKNEIQRIFSMERNLTLHLFFHPFHNLCAFFSFYFVLFYVFIACIYSYCTSKSQTFIFYSLMLQLLNGIYKFIYESGDWKDKTQHKYAKKNEKKRKSRQ